MRYFKWGYSWEEIKSAYIQKQKEQLDRTSAFCEFLLELASACMGAKPKDEIGLDTGEGMDELTDDQIENMKAVLGEADFQRMYPDFA